jgi:hypothetical protein
MHSFGFGCVLALGAILVGCLGSGPSGDTPAQETVQTSEEAYSEDGCRVGVPDHYEDGAFDLTVARGYSSPTCYKSVVVEAFEYPTTNGSLDPLVIQWKDSIEEDQAHCESAWLGATVYVGVESSFDNVGASAAGGGGVVFQKSGSASVHGNWNANTSRCEGPYIVFLGSVLSGAEVSRMVRVAVTARTADTSAAGTRGVEIFTVD